MVYLLAIMSRSRTKELIASATGSTCRPGSGGV